MPVKLEATVDKNAVRRMSTRPDLAPGFFAALPQQVTRKENEEEPLSLLIRLCPLRDPEDGDSIDKNYAIWANIYPSVNNPLNPEHEPEQWKIQKSNEFLLALDSSLPGAVVWQNKMPMVEGEVIAKKDVDQARIAANMAAIQRSFEVWNMEDDELEEFVCTRTVFVERYTYTNKQGDEKIGVRFLRDLPADAELLPEDSWEYYPEV